MPIYKYSCLDCGEIFELRRNLGDSDSEIKCPKCNKQHTRRILSAFASKSSGDNCAPSSNG